MGSNFKKLLVVDIGKKVMNQIFFMDIGTLTGLEFVIY